ncbi:MAG: hypothetical protein KA436_08065 [Oligoflexales bacterium]|nr:hypothetical protein [Oligoflexales bacterium]
MFDINEFKRKVKEWIASHPQGDHAELFDFCEEIIPPALFASHQWLVDQTVAWYQHILQSRLRSLQSHPDFFDEED